MLGFRGLEKFSTPFSESMTDGLFVRNDLVVDEEGVIGRWYLGAPTTWSRRGNARRAVLDGKVAFTSGETG
jgi:hypothetical protein